MRRLLVGGGLACLAAAAAWRFALASRWTQRLPPGWSASQRYVGIETYPDEKTGQLPARDALSEYERAQRLVSEAGRPDSVQFEDRLTIRDIATGHIIWEYVTHEVVDPRTGRHLAPDHRSEVAVFPRDAERGTYRLRSNYVKGIALGFTGEDDLDGLTTYRFAYQGRGEYTESYSGTAQYPGVHVRPGEEIRCADDQFYFNVWIEPVTGELVKLEEGCPSGDYVYDVATNERRQAVDRWHGVTDGDAVIQRIAEVRRLRWRYLWAARYLPLTFLAAGVVLLGLGVRRPP